MGMGFGLTLQRFFQHLCSEPLVALNGITHSIKDIIEILFFYFAELSFMSFYVIPFILIIRFTIRKAQKKYSYILWGIVFLKLVTSMNIEIFNYGLIPHYYIDKIYHNMTPDFAASYSHENGIVSQVQSNFTISVPEVASVYVPALIWFTVLCVLLTVTIVKYFSFYLKVKRSSTCAKNNIFISDFVEIPVVLGVIHPKIYLPNNLTEQYQCYVITHENTHINRFDHIIKIFFYVITCVHWFNPLVWLSFFLFEKDMEVSCDEKVIEKLGHEHKKDYSYCILDFSTHRKLSPKAYLSFGDSDAKLRIKNILNYKKQKFWMVILLPTIILFIIIGMFTYRKVVYMPKLEIDHEVYHFPEYVAPDGDERVFAACEKEEPALIYADYLQQELVPSTEDMEIMEILSLSEEYDLFIRNNNKYSQYVMFSSDVNIKNFEFFTIAVPKGDKIEYHAEKPVLHYDGISAHKSLVIKMDMPETLPWYGISYTDENGDTVKYAIFVSGKDGSVVLDKFC